MASANLDSKLKPLTDDVRRLNATIIGVVVVIVGIVLGLMFTLGAMITSDLAVKQATSQQIRDEIHAQNEKIDALTKALQDEQKAIQETD